jgi:hypothetical protein
MSDGRKSTIGLAFQNSYGTVADTSSLTFFEFMSESITEKIEQLTATGMRGIYDNGDSEEGAKSIDGDLNIEARALDVGVLLKAMFGDPTTTQEDSAAVYNHIWEPRQDDWDDVSAQNPVTIHKFLNDGGSASLFYDMNASVLEMSLANGDFLKTKVGFVGGSVSQNAATTASYNTGKRFKWDQASLSIDGSANCDYRDFTLTIEESIEPQHTMCATAYPSRIKRTDFRTVSVGATLVYKDRTELEAFRSQSERPMVVTITGAATISSGYTDVLKIDVPLLRYSEADASAGGAGSLELPVSGMAKYSVTSATALRFTLTNTQATY